MSAGAAVGPRLPVGTRLAAITACSINVALVKDNAVASRAPSTIWPRPDFAFSISAASVPNAQCSAVPKSTQLTAARYGGSPAPVMYTAPDITCPTPSQPTPSDPGPGPPNAVAVVRTRYGCHGCR